LQGGRNNLIGRQATIDLFLVVAELVKNYVTSQDEKRITIQNAAGKRVIIALASDPDIRIQEEFGEVLRKKVAIEIKGGTDASNAHNRAGEAEKSHQKAKKDGFRDFWTIISKSGVRIEKLRAESPTTNDWFDVGQVLVRDLVEHDASLDDTIIGDMSMAAKDVVHQTPTTVVVYRGTRQAFAGVPAYSLLKQYLDGLLAR
jgi:hypothetical protein